MTDELKQEAEECMHNALFWLKLPISKENVEQGGSYILKLLEPKEKENSELKLKLEALDGQTPWKDIKDKSEVIGKLTKAKELLKEFVHHYKAKTIYIENMQDLLEQSEQFLRETDIDNAIQKANEGLDLDKIADEVEQDIKEQKVK